MVTASVCPASGLPDPLRTGFSFAPLWPQSPVPACKNVLCSPPTGAEAQPLPPFETHITPTAPPHTMPTTRQLSADAAVTTLAQLRRLWESCEVCAGVWGQGLRCSSWRPGPGPTDTFLLPEKQLKCWGEGFGMRGGAEAFSSLAGRGRGSTTRPSDLVL